VSFDQRLCGGEAQAPINLFRMKAVPPRYATDAILSVSTRVSDIKRIVKRNTAGKQADGV